MAGPESLPIAEFVGRFLAATGDRRTVVADPHEIANVLGSDGIHYTSEGYRWRAILITNALAATFPA